MASVSPAVIDFSIQSSFTVYYTSPDWYCGNHVTGTATKSYDLSAIPTGSTINSATLYSTTTLSAQDIRLLQLNVNAEGVTNFYDISAGVRYKDVKTSVQALITAGTKTLSIEYRFGATDLTPTGAGTGTKTATMTFASNSLAIDYTPPYTKCTAPTAISVSPSSTGKSKTASLSWSGAGNGTNNTVNGYDVYSSTTSSSSGFTLLSSPTASPINVTSSATNGGVIYYKIVAKGTAGASYYSDLSSAYASLTTTWTDATAPNSVTGPTNVVMSTAQQISWSGASGGTNNPISKYQVFYSGDNYAASIAETTGTSASVTAHATNGSSYTYKVKAVAEQNSVLSTASHTMKSLVGNITPPSSVAYDANNLAPSGQTVIRWSGQAGGTNNAIVSYDIQTSTDNATWTFVANTTNTSYSPAIASATNNATVYYRIKLKGERIDAYSSSIGLVTTVTKPNPPSAISLNDDNLPVGWSTAKTLSWSGASAGTYNNAIYGYRVMVSTNGGALTQYGSDLVTGFTYGSVSVTSLAANGTQKFYVHTIGATTVAAEKLSAQSTATDTLTTTVTNPTAPTASVPTNAAPGSTQSLSWSGAQNGTNNNITTYQIYEKVDSGAWTSVGPDATSPFTVTAHASNNGTKSYYIVADAPHGDSPASATVVMTTTVSKPNAPSTVSLSTTSNLAPDADVTLSWSGASNATYNNPVNGYRVMRSVDGGAYAQVGPDLPLATTSLIVKTKNGNGTHAFKVMALGTNLGIHSDMSTSVATATTVVSTPSAPSLVEVVGGGGVAPLSVKLLKWSGAVAGTYNNPIKGYQVYRSTDNVSYSAFGNAILDPNTYYEMNVEAPANDGASYYYKVVTLGNTLSINSAMSSVAGVLTTAKLPSTGTLNKTSVTATGSEFVTVTISPQLTTYSHKVTWYIDATYTSDVITKAAGTTTDTYAVPQSWILATTTTTTSTAAKCKVETFDGAVSLGVNEYSFTVNVPGKSAFTMAGVPLTATGSSSATATIAANYSGYKHTVVWSTSGYSQTHNVAAGIATQAYAIPKAWCSAAPNATSFTVTVTTTTIKVTADGDLSLGSNSTTFTANVPADVIPTISAFSSTGVNLNWSLYVRTKSSVTWAPVASGAYSSTIVSYKVENAYLNSGVLPYSAGTSWTSGTLDYSGNQTFTLTVTDSRGRTATTTGSVMVTNYNSPAIASAAFARADSNGTINRVSGIYANLTAAFVYSNIGTNAITAKAYYKEVGTGTWLPAGGAAVTITGTAPNMSGTVTYSAGSIVTTKLYDVKVTLTDAYSTIETANIIPTVARVFDLKNDRAAFGGIATIANALQVPVGWTLYANGNKEVFHDGRTVPIANGGTGATTAAAALTSLGLTATAAELNKLDGATATTAQLNFVTGVTSAIQTQLDGKSATGHTHTKANITDFPTTMAPSAHTHLIADLPTIPVANGGTGATTAAAALTNLGITATAAEVNYTSDVTSLIQAQINGKAATSHTHTKANITDFPTSMPASDVSAWAKAATKPSYAYSEITSPPSLAFLPLAGGTMTGALTVTDINFNSSNNTDVNYLYFKNYVSNYDALMYSNAVGTTVVGSQIVFRQYSRAAATGAPITTSYENYVIPVTPLDMATATPTYTFLTTKAVVSLAQGGTGATTAAAALTNLGITATAAEVNYTSDVTSLIQAQINGKAATAHTHTKANITDFPASLPASDVSAWAKAATKPAYTAAEVGAAATSHTHTYMPVAGGTFTGNIVAIYSTDYTTLRVRNIVFADNTLPATTTAQNGAICVVY